MRISNDGDIGSVHCRGQAVVAALQPAECPDCESVEEGSVLREQWFIHGQGQSAVELKCLVPVYTCAQCECQWTGGEAEDARQEAVDRHFEQVRQCQNM